MDPFWNKVMPACVANYPWGKEFAGELSQKKWEKGLKNKIQKMDDSEFDLFLAGVVMSASKEQLMGVNLTEKINFFRELRK
ncbi:MAG TPA: hypothetical protein VF837_01915 [Patescibacteria group bacterium]